MRLPITILHICIWHNCSNNCGFFSFTVQNLDHSLRGISHVVKVFKISFPHYLINASIDKFNKEVEIVTPLGLSQKSLIAYTRTNLGILNNLLYFKLNNYLIWHTLSPVIVYNWTIQIGMLKLWIFVQANRFFGYLTK